MELNALGFFGQPIGARRDPSLVSESGRPLYRDAAGNVFEVTPQPTYNALAGRALMQAAQDGRAYDPLLGDYQPSSPLNALAAIAQGAWDGVSAPGRAAAGEPVTYGDVWSTALDYGGVSNLGTAPAGALRGGTIRAYHGSPHDFDRFSLDKIGTGEGAQAYGHGLYFAESEDVARSYRDALSSGIDGTGLAVRIDGTPVKDATVDQIRAARFGVQSTAEGIRRQMEAAQRRLATASDADELGIGVSDRDLIQMDIDDLSQRLGEIERLAGRVEMGPAGRMYEVNINADPADFLDWDAPLSAQPGVSGKIRSDENIGFLAETYADHKSPMQALEYNIGARRDLFPSPENYRANTAQKLRELGIPGIKYLDAGSRGAGDGSRNFVVFDDRLIEIVRKYGIAGAAALTGMTAAEIQAGMGQAEAAPAPDIERYLSELGL